MSSEAFIQNELRPAIDAYQAGNLTLAASRVDKVLASYPDHPEATLAKGMIVLAQGDQNQALRWFESSLQADPSNTEALAWAAFVNLNLHRFAEGEQLARRMTLADPRNPRGFYLLGSALRALDRIEEALKAVDQALSLTPEDVDSLVLKARLLRKWQMPGLATELYRRALSIRPSLPAAVDLARTLLHENQPAEALEVLQSVSTSLPEQNRPYALIAQANTELQRFEDADRQWALAERYARDKTLVIQSRATAEIAVGRFEVAEGLLRKLIDQGLLVPLSFFTLTTARKMRPDDRPLIERMQGLASKPGLSSDQLINLHYGLGKSFDDLKEFEQAIRHFDEANRICYEIYPGLKSFSLEDAKALTDLQIQTFNPDRIRELSAGGLDSRLPLFVVGMMRSGTTLTESILGAHSQVKGMGEQAFWIERSREFLISSPEGLEIDLDTVKRFAPEYLQLLDPHDDSVRHVVDKNPANFDLSAMLHCVYPNAKFVHLKRNPVDNLLSLWMTPVSANVRYASNKENLVFAYREHVRLLKHFLQALPSDRFASFQYEDLTSQPEQTIGSILDHVGLEPESACFAPEKSSRAVLTPSVHQVRQPIHQGSQARWKNYEPWLGAFGELLE
ncbi:MAG TPA: sulfotransferase [Fimbriimonas sp.]|nr:sulfotransferase [Fimbriimonas sp.]